jgi:hypothetical protein
VRLERVPSAYLVAFFGKFGSGKTLTAIEQAIRVANFEKKSIASNVFISPLKILHYCRKFKFDWLATQIERDLLLRKQSFSVRRSQVLQGLPLMPIPPWRSVIVDRDINSLLNNTNCVIIIDEGATAIFSRNFSERGRKELIDRMVRVRHYKNRIFIVSQNDLQIDKQFRLCLNAIVHCDSFVFKDKLIVRRAFLFDALSYEEFCDKYQGRAIAPITKSGFRFILRPLGLLRLFGKPREDYLFSCYDSFDSFSGYSGRKYSFFSVPDSL